MDVSSIVSQLVPILAPALPYLVLASQKTTDAIAKEVGKDVWRKAKEIWKVILPRLDKQNKGQIERIADDLKVPTQKQQAQNELRSYLHALLEHDSNLAVRIESILQQPSMHQEHREVEAHTIHNSVITQGDHTTINYVTHAQGRTVEVQEKFVSVRLPNGKYPVLRWTRQVGSFGPMGPVENERWTPPDYSYEKMKEYLVSEINKLIADGWELVEHDIDSLWVYDEEYVQSVSGAILQELLGVSANLGAKYKYKRTYKGAKFHIRKIK